MLCPMSERSRHTAIVTRVLILITLLQAAASAQTSPPPQSYQQCTLTNGTATGFFGGVTASGTFTSGATPDTSSITVSEPAGPYTYTFTGPSDGPGWTQVSQIVVFCVLAGCPPPPSILPPGAAIFRLLDQGSGVAAISFEDTGELFTGFGTLSCVSVTPPPPPPNCSAESIAIRNASAAARPHTAQTKTFKACGGCVDFTLTVTGNGTRTIGATLQPGGGMTLQEAATACGYPTGFNWQQLVTNLPCPSPLNPATGLGFVPNDSSVLPGNRCGPPTAGALTAGGSFNDPPQSGYNLPPIAALGHGYNPYPFYYELPDVTSINRSAALNPTAVVVRPDDKTLQFADGPSDWCLPTEASAAYGKPPIPGLIALRNQYCGGTTNAFSSTLGFETRFVGMVDAQTASSALAYWTWTDDFNGQVGSVNGIGGITVPGLSSGGTVIPGTGYGGIKLTSLNGVPVPPIVTADQIKTTASGLAYSRVSQTFNGTVTITNISGTTITTPTNFQVVLAALPPGVTLVNSAGAFNQSPYITVPTMTSLAPAQSVTVKVQFQNSSGATINFKPEFYAGSFQ
jgi:hypothetical protein